MNYVEPTEEYFEIFDDETKNALVILDNVSIIYVHNFNVGSSYEHYAIEFVFNDNFRHYWRFGSKEVRDINYRNIIDAISVIK